MIRTKAIPASGPCNNRKKIGAPISLWLTPVFRPFATRTPNCPAREPEEQTLLIECSSGTIVILDRLCQRRCQACAFERRIRGLVCVRIQKLGNFEFATSQHGLAIAEQQHAKVVVEHFGKRLFELRGIVEFLLGNQAQSAWRVANDRIAEEQNAS
jgi:hypothetical protein